MRAAPQPSLKAVRRLIRSIAARDAITQHGGVTYYRADERNYCTSCCGASWHVGRVTAECARCGHAIPLVHPAAGTAGSIEGN